MKLTKTKAKKLALELAPQITPESQRDFFLVHTQGVVNIAKQLAKKTHGDQEFYEIAGRVHDIGYTKDIKNHARCSLEILKDLGYEISKKLEDCILRHGRNEEPKTFEGKIFQLADKLSIFDSKIIEMLLTHSTFPLKKQDSDFLKDMSEQAILLLENF